MEENGITGLLAKHGKHARMGGYREGMQFLRCLADQRPEEPPGVSPGSMVSGGFMTAFILRCNMQGADDCLSGIAHCASGPLVPDPIGSKVFQLSDPRRNNRHLLDFVLRKPRKCHMTGNPHSSRYRLGRSN
jgi:hypothetical protein